MPGTTDEEFLSLVTHELRTPLTPLKTIAQLIRSRIRRSREGTKPLDMDALERNLLQIERQVDRMDRLITDLLDVSRVSRGRFEVRPSPFDLTELVREVVDRYADITSDEGRHHISLGRADPVTVNADRARLEQALSNLVGNAVKFSPYGGEVRIGLARDDGTVTVTVRDEGVGIPAEEIAKLCQPFVRGERATGYAGIGVGLYLSRLVAERHGGRLELESEGTDRGTTARLSLPLV